MKKIAYNTIIVLLWVIPWALPILLVHLIDKQPLLAVVLIIGVWIGLLKLAGWLMEKIDSTVDWGEFDDAGGTIPHGQDSPYESPILILVIPLAIAVVCLIAWYIRR